LNLFAFLCKQKRWSKETFGDTPRTEGLLRHIEKEVQEVRANPDDLSEWCDIIILAFDGMWRRGATPAQICSALVKKQAVNMARTYTRTPDDVPSEHVRRPVTGSDFIGGKA